MELILLYLWLWILIAQESCASAYSGLLQREVERRAQCRRRGSSSVASIIDVDSRTKERELFPGSPMSKHIPPPSQEGVSLSPFVNACRTLGAHVGGGGWNLLCGTSVRGKESEPRGRWSRVTMHGPKERAGIRQGVEGWSTEAVRN